MTLPAEKDFALIKIGGGESFTALCGLQYLGDEPPPEKLEDWPKWLQPAFIKGRDGPVLEDNPYPRFYRNGRYNQRHDAWEWGQLV